jgi:hypothetical protein
MHGLHIVARAVQQIVGGRIDQREMRRDQLIVGGVEPAQKIVEWPIARAGQLGSFRNHWRFLSSQRGQ